MAGLISGSGFEDYSDNERGSASAQYAAGAGGGVRVQSTALALPCQGVACLLCLVRCARVKRCNVLRVYTYLWSVKTYGFIKTRLAIELESTALARLQIPRYPGAWGIYLMRSRGWRLRRTWYERGPALQQSLITESVRVDCKSDCCPAHLRVRPELYGGRRQCIPPLGSRPV